MRVITAMSARLPTSSLGRLGRTALAALRGGRVARLGRGEAMLAVDDLAAFVSSVGQLKGMAMKAGQLVSHLDLPLPQDVRVALTALQTHSPPMPFERVVAIVKEELGRNAAPLLARMEPTAAAAASVGQVHRATLPDGTEVAVRCSCPKSRAPSPRTSARRPRRRASSACSSPARAFKAVVREARRAVLYECDYDREARYHRKPPEGNSRPAGIARTHEARRKRGELAPYY